MGKRSRLRSILRMRRSLLYAATCVAIVAGGCSSGDDGTPVACRAPASDYADALGAAPGSVTLDGGTPISDCLVADQSPAELGEVGESVIEAATQLNAAARSDPDGDSALALGYLVGALQQGASETGGIHTDLLRRLDAAARFAPAGEPPDATFERDFGQGYAAGQQDG